jgi:hypothetical protein
VVALEQRLLQRALKTLPPFLRECEFRPVKTKEEFIACSTLVHNEYVRKQYMIPHQNRLRLDAHQMTQKSTTFIALYQKRYILATLTLVEDSAFGVPMDKIYKSDLDNERAQKKTFGEVTMLAANTNLLQDPASGFKQSDQMVILMYLFREMLAHARISLGLESLVACFHPRHALFYRALHFKELGGLKAYGNVKGSPALAYKLSINALEHEASVLGTFFGLDALVQTMRLGTPFYRFRFEEFFQIFANLDPAA